MKVMIEKFNKGNAKMKIAYTNDDGKIKQTNKWKKWLRKLQGERQQENCNKGFIKRSMKSRLHLFEYNFGLD